MPDTLLCPLCHGARTVMFRCYLFLLRTIECRECDGLGQLPGPLTHAEAAAIVANWPDDDADEEPPIFNLATLSWDLIDAAGYVDKEGVFVKPRFSVPSAQVLAAREALIERCRLDGLVTVAA